MDLSYLRFLARKGSSYLHPIGKLATQTLLKHLNLSPGQSVLEIGCGTGGSLVHTLAFADVRLFGVDILWPMLKTAARRLQFCRLSDRAAIAQVNARALPFPEGTFDRILVESVFGFHPGDQIPGFLQEIHRVLKIDGLCGIIEAIWVDEISTKQIQQIASEGIERFGLAPAALDSWLLKEWQAGFSQAGFKLIESSLISQDLKVAQAVCPSEVGDILKLSDRYSRWQKARSLLSFSQLLDHYKYRRRLRSFPFHQQLLEAYLFIINKPDTHTQQP